MRALSVNLVAMQRPYGGNPTAMLTTSLLIWKIYLLNYLFSQMEPEQGKCLFGMKHCKCRNYIILRIFFPLCFIFFCLKNIRNPRDLASGVKSNHFLQIVRLKTNYASFYTTCKVPAILHFDLI